jgi:signal transduction histidine kinase
MDPRIQTIEDIKEEMELLNQVSSNLSDMISSMLVDARNSENTLEEVDVNSLIAQVKSILFIPPQITLNVKEKLPVIFTNRIKLQHVFQNLIGNALKYHNKESGKILIGFREETDFYQFFVEDDGVGICKSDQERIFEQYEITNNVSAIDSSSGLGLSSIKTVIEEQGGKIWVESIPLIGSTFYFTWKK